MEHFEEKDFEVGKLIWKIDGTSREPNPTVRQDENNEGTDFWDISGIVSTTAELNSLKLEIHNDDSVEEKKTLVDHIYVVVEGIGLFP